VTTQAGAIIKVFKTSYPPLGYCNTGHGWRFVDTSDGGTPYNGSCVGRPYPSKAELLAALPRYASEFGCGDPAPTATTIPRACLTCAFFRLSMGEPGYSEMTPGSPANISCTLQGKRGCAWPKSFQDYSDVDTPALITRAEKCKLYETHPALLPVTVTIKADASGLNDALNLAAIAASRPPVKTKSQTHRVALGERRK
jgi:hypothetical protein